LCKVTRRIFFENRIMKRPRLTYHVVATLLFANTLWARQLHPWQGVWGNLSDSYTGTNLIYHGSAIAATGVFVGAGWDAQAQRWFQKENPIGDDVGYAMVVAGWFWQIAPGAFMYLYGWGKDNHDLMGGGAAAIQAVALVGAITMILKVASGRRQPLKDGVFEYYGPSGHQRSASDADFQFFNHNIRNESLRIAWPSGHTSSTVAFVSALAAYYPDKWYIKAVGYPAALFMALSMVDYDAHWTSDVIAGALIGHAIGYTVGRNFRLAAAGKNFGDQESRESSASLETHFSVVPRADRLVMQLTGVLP